MKSFARVLVAALAACLVLTSASGGAVAEPNRPAAASSTIPLPHLDPFYRYTGSKPLAQIRPGTVLKQRSTTLTLASLPTPVVTEQLLYRTRDQRGRPAVTVTTVIGPLGNVTKRIVGYLSFYDALGDMCDPSYTLRGGNAGTAANNQQAAIESALVTLLVAQGSAVTVPDFEGEGLHWVAGQESGWSTLDAVRATESFLKADAASTKVGLLGYSGGSIGGEWASELAPSYAPELNIVGTAIGGLPVDLAHNLKYVDGSKEWSGVIPAVLVSLSRAFGVKMAKYESAYGRKLVKAVGDQCIGSFNGKYPGLRVAQLLKPKYKDFLKIPAITRIINKLIMGSTPGRPRMPMMIGVGDHDGIGDDVMIVKDAAALAHQYCRQGLPINFQIYQKSSHTAAGLQFLPQAMLYLQQRFAGVAPTNNCASIPPGNSLAPLPVHKKKHHAKRHHKR